MQPAPRYPDIRFAVISDLHLYDPILGSEGAAFEEVFNSDRKLLLDSEALLDYAIDQLLSSSIRFVLVAGDLTKDGELIGHQQVSAKLQRLVDTGIEVFVVPGNHDINNTEAFRFVGDTMQLVETITADQFASLYQNMGYKRALSRDASTLSYVAEPVNGLWILAIDDCRYAENVAGVEPIVGGAISQDTEQWITSVLAEALAQDKAVIVLMHHGIVEHWNGQAKLHPDYIVDDFSHVSRYLASYHVRVGFTGHYHAQDITKAQFEDTYLYDIETGSLVTSPCPIRYCTIRDNSLSTTNNYIVDKLYPGTTFAADAESFVKKTVALEAYNTLKGYKVSDSDADYIADAVADAFVAHYNGDEQTAQRPVFEVNRLSPWGRFIYSMQKYVLNGLWVDLAPADNAATLDLN